MTVLAERPRESTGPRSVRERPRSWLLPAVTLCGVVLGAWQVARPSPWRDEIVTLAVSSRSPAELLDLAGHVDAVLTPYYLLAHAVPGAHLTGIRLISAAALAATGALIVWLCRLLERPQAAGWAAATLLVAPTASRFGQEARPYALAMMLATAATCLLVRAITVRSARAWSAYAAALVLLGMMQLVGLLLVTAHALTVVIGARAAARRWAASTAAAGVLIAPLVWIGAGQRHAVAWITTPDTDRLARFPTFLTGSQTLLTLWVVAVIAAMAVHHRPSPDAAPKPAVTSVAAPWILLPPVGLFMLGQVTTLYSERYLLFCLPAVALLVGFALSRLPLIVACALVAAMIIASVPGHLHVRSDTGHGEDLRTLLATIDAQRNHGDAVAFIPGDTRMMAEAYPGTFRGMDDVTLGRSPADSGTLAGARATPAEVATVMATHQRVWVVGNPGHRNRERPTQAALDALANGFTTVGSWRPGTFTLDLYQRRP